MSMFWSATTAASSSGGIATSRVGAVAAELGDKVLSAAKAGDLSEIRKLLTAGVDKDFAGAGGRTALMHASIHGRNNVAEYLVSIGADVNKTNNNKWTALHWACNSGHIGLAEYLIHNGADINMVNDSGETPLDKLNVNEKSRLLIAANSMDIPLPSRYHRFKHSQATARSHASHFGANDDNTGGDDEMDALMGLDPEVRDTIIELQQENMDLSASLATKTDELEACRAQLLRTQTERDALRDQVTTVRLEARDQLNAVINERDEAYLQVKKLEVEVAERQRQLDGIKQETCIDMEYIQGSSSSTCNNDEVTYFS